MHRLRKIVRPATTVAVLMATLLACGIATAFDYQAFFQQHCIKCHGPEKQEAKLRLDTLAPPDGQRPHRKAWVWILEMLDAEAMPPPEAPQPGRAEIEKLSAWISSELARTSQPVPALRRLNRFEYENTVHDLMGIDAPLAELLPEDASVQGFDNVAGGLGLSAILMERYLEAADAAFEASIRRIKPLPAETRRAVLMENKDNIGSVKGNKGGVIEREGAFVDFTPGWPPARIDAAHPIDEGLYRCRIAVWPHEPNEHRTLTVAVFAGPLFGPGKRRFVGMFDVTGTPEKPRIIDFTTRMGAGHSLHILPWIFPEHVTWRDKHEKRPGVAIAWTQTHGPLDQSFPSQSQKKLFGESNTLKMAEGNSVYIRHRRGVKAHYVASDAPREDAARIIRTFARRAFRRPVDDELAEQFVQLTWSRLERGSTFEQAVRAGVTAVLCSPHFLLINQKPEVDDYTIASRLSYFLWSSMPDEELLKLAAAGKLSDPTVRYAQVERMIKDPKIERFIVNFTGQWLDLREIEFTTPDKKLYPEYDELLLRSMLAETHGFFRHMLVGDLSVTNFVDSDFAVLNQRLATHYGIAGVRGHEKFRVVKLSEESVRGGILTHASVLKVTANGTSTSPVIRGAWVLDKLLGQPAPPPPAGVPAVEPDIRGATSIREQLAKHRENESCNRCHSRIDPPGFALEEFDVIGGHRERYRALGDRKNRSIDWVKNTRYGLAQSVDSSGELRRGRKFANFAEFRERLKEDPDIIAASLAEKLLVYGSGRPIGPGDRASIRSVVNATRKNDHGLRSMIHAVVESEMFLRP